MEWKPDCGCKLARSGFTVTRPENGDAPRCTARTEDGKLTDVPLRKATLEEMAAGEQHKTFWSKRREKQVADIARAEAAVAEAETAATVALQSTSSVAATRAGQAVSAARANLLRAQRAAAYVCRRGCAFSPGTRIKARVVESCPAHQDLTDRDIQSQRLTLACGCVVRQFTTGEGRSGPKETWLRQTLSLCPAHEETGVPDV